MENKFNCINCSAVFEGNGASCCDANCLEEFQSKQSEKTNPYTKLLKRKKKPLNS